MLCFHGSIKRSSSLWTQHFDRRCVCNQLSGNAGISVWRIVWIAIKCCFMNVWWSIWVWSVIFIWSMFRIGKGKGLSHNRPSRWPKGVRAPDFLTFGTTRVVDRQPHAPAAFTPREIPGTNFLEAELTPGHMVLSVSTRKIPVTD